MSFTFCAFCAATHLGKSAKGEQIKCAQLRNKLVGKLDVIQISLSEETRSAPVFPVNGEMSPPHKF